MKFPLILLSAALALTPVTAAQAGSVDLHSHLFMKEGLSWLFRGEFNGPLQAKTWKDKLSSQANPETLDQSGLGVVVVSLYAHPLFVWSPRESIRRQIDQAEAFVRAHPDWIIARTAGEAKQARREGKKVLILALEGASGVIETPQDFEEFVDRRGIRIVTYLHLIDDYLGGVAFLKGYKALMSPVAFLESLFSKAEGPVRTNPNGLSQNGKSQLQTFLDRKIWIDLAHSSDRAQREMIPVLQAAKQPLLYTHTTLRRHFQAERGISDWQLEAVRDSGGIVGLMPSQEMLVGTPGASAPNCSGDIHALATQYRETSAVIGAASTVLGTDHNGGIPHLPPTCGAPLTGTSLDREGFWNVAQQKELWESLRRLGAPVPKSLEITVDRFLDTWARVNP